MPYSIYDFKITGSHDKPKEGMWHTGPNPSWVTITHTPTMMQVRAYGRTQHKVRARAMAALELMLDDSDMEHCQFPESAE